MLSFKKEKSKKIIQQSKIKIDFKIMSVVW